MSNPITTIKPRPHEASEPDELTLDKETIADLDPSDHDAAGVRGGLSGAPPSAGWGCTDGC